MHLLPTHPLLSHPLLSLLLLTPPILAQSTSTTPSSSSSSAHPTPYAGSNAYTYLGCYNETTGYADAGNVRALAGGTMEGLDSMTAAQCLSFCGAGKGYAGLEYGRECWCAGTLNANAGKLPDGDCNTPCMGDGTEVCGGTLKLTLYQNNGSSSATGKSAAGKNDANTWLAWGSGAMSVALMVLAAL